MPDLPDDLAALLRDRAEHAPVPRAADDAIVHAVRRRQYARAGTFVSGTALAVAAVVGVAAAVTPTRTGTLGPTTGGGGTQQPGERETGCAFLRQEATADAELYLGDTGTFTPDDRLTLSAEPAPPRETSHEEPPTEPTAEPTADPAPAGDAPPEYGFTADVDTERNEFRQASYETRAGTTCLVATNDGAGRHHLQLRRADTGAVVWDGPWMSPRMAYVHDEQPPLAAGRYTLVCTVHPAMRADVTAR